MSSAILEAASRAVVSTEAHLTRRSLLRSCSAGLERVVGLRSVKWVGLGSLKDCAEGWLF